jgi:hypothetical protein
MRPLHALHADNVTKQQGKRLNLTLINITNAYHSNPYVCDSREGTADGHTATSRAIRIQQFFKKNLISVPLLPLSILKALSIYTFLERLLLYFLFYTPHSGILKITLYRLSL